MIVLDTDGLSHLQKTDPVGVLIAGRLDASPDREVRITAVTAYEMMGGAVSLIERRKRQHGDLVSALRLLQDLAEYLGVWRGLILPFDASCDQVYRQFSPHLRQEMKDDARIAAIALTNGAAVWTCNVDDYARVPGLTVVRAEAGAIGS